MPGKSTPSPPHIVTWSNRTSPLHQVWATLSPSGRLPQVLEVDVEDVRRKRPYHRGPVRLAALHQVRGLVDDSEVLPRHFALRPSKLSSTCSNRLAQYDSGARAASRARFASSHARWAQAMSSYVFIPMRIRSESSASA